MINITTTLLKRERYLNTALKFKEFFENLCNTMISEELTNYLVITDMETEMNSIKQLISDTPLDFSLNIHTKNLSDVRYLSKLSVRLNVELEEDTVLELMNAILQSTKFESLLTHIGITQSSTSSCVSINIEFDLLHLVFNRDKSYNNEISYLFQLLNIALEQLTKTIDDYVIIKEHKTYYLKSIEKSEDFYEKVLELTTEIPKLAVELVESDIENASEFKIGLVR